MGTCSLAAIGPMKAGKLEAVQVRDVDQGLRDRARTFRGAKVVLVFGNLRGDQQRVVAHGAEGVGNLVGSVMVHIEGIVPRLAKLKDSHGNRESLRTPAV
jgi:hypothetical protein